LISEAPGGPFRRGFFFVRFDIANSDKLSITDRLPRSSEKSSGIAKRIKLDDSAAGNTVICRPELNDRNWAEVRY
jgi:hypothetical protein